MENNLKVFWIKWKHWVYVFICLVVSLFVFVKRSKASTNCLFFRKTVTLKNGIHYITQKLKTKTESIIWWKNSKINANTINQNHANPSEWSVHNEHILQAINIPKQDTKKKWKGKVFCTQNELTLFPHSYARSIR